MKAHHRPALGHLAALFVLFAVGGAFPAHAREIAAPEGYTPVIAVFPYFCPDPADAKELAWAVFAVPDMVRERLLSGNRFVLSEKSELARKASEAGLADDYFTGEESRLAAARAVGADFLAWGYILRTGGGLKVFHGLADAATGRTLHIESAVLPEGKELIAVMEISVLSFEEWTKSTLPEKIIPPARTEVLVVQKEIPVPAQKNGFSLTPSAGYLSHPWTFSDSLKPSLAASLLLGYAPFKQSFYNFGFDVSFTILNAVNPDIQKIEIVMMPLLLSAGLQVPLADFMDFGFSVSGGACLIFGRVNMEFLSYVRPALAAETALLFFPRGGVSVIPGIRVFYVFSSYQNQNMTAVEPKLGIRFKL